MDINRLIKKEMEKYGDKVVVGEVPENMRPTPESLLKLNSEIAASAAANDAMMQRSMMFASGRYYNM